MGLRGPREANFNTKSGNANNNNNNNNNNNSNNNNNKLSSNSISNDVNTEPSNPYNAPSTPKKALWNPANASPHSSYKQSNDLQPTSFSLNLKRPPKTVGGRNSPSNRYSPVRNLTSNDNDNENDNDNDNENYNYNHNRNNNTTNNNNNNKDNDSDDDENSTVLPFPQSPIKYPSPSHTPLFDSKPDLSHPNNFQNAKSSRSSSPALSMPPRSFSPLRKIGSGSTSPSQGPSNRYSNPFTDIANNHQTILPMGRLSLSTNASPELNGIEDPFTYELSNLPANNNSNSINNISNTEIINISDDEDDQDQLINNNLNVNDAQPSIGGPKVDYSYDTAPLITNCEYHYSQDGFENDLYNAHTENTVNITDFKQNDKYQKLNTEEQEQGLNNVIDKDLKTYQNDEYDNKSIDSRDSTNNSFKENDNENPVVLSVEDFASVPDNAQPRRYREMARKQIELTHGNLILDCPVPTKLQSFLPRRDHDEYRYMRYTAATCDPNNFANSGYTLRAADYQREIELAVCITMYNENELSFARTMHSVMKNVAYLCSRNKSRMWGEDGWKKVVVTIVSDGRHKIHPRVLDTLAAVGVYQDGIAKNLVNGKEVMAHIYEYTTQVSIDADMKFKGAEKGIVPVQVVFCLKEKNLKKLNSHRWFFNGFCPILQPNICVMIDVGTRPGNHTLYHLWKAFDRDSNVAGACGEIIAEKGKVWKNLINPLVAAQNFEYKISNILDKPMESVFGYISVLPGALSAYRYIALKNDENGEGPLTQYFKGEHAEGNPSSNIFTANMYLAEDRILCWELLSRKSEKWLLRYVSAATGETDVPDTIPEFVSQRRRWLNGSFFAALYSQLHFKQIWYTDHSVIRKLFLTIEFIYQFFSLLFSFFSLGNFYLAFYFIAGALASSDAAYGSTVGLVFFVILRIVCIIVMGSQFIISLGNRPQGAKNLYLISFIIFGIIIIYITICSLYYIIHTIVNEGQGVSIGNNGFTNIVVSLISTYGIYWVWSFLYLDPWHMLTSFVQYSLMIPSYICTLQVYALCNTHDVSWGTKGDNELHMDLGSAAVIKSKSGQEIVEIEIPSGQTDIDAAYDDALTSLRERTPDETKPIDKQLQKEDYYQEVRTRVVLIWLTANIILVEIMIQLFSYEEPGKNGYLTFMLWSVFCLTAFKALGSLCFLIIQNVKKMVYTRDSVGRNSRAFFRSLPDRFNSSVKIMRN